MRINLAILVNILIRIYPLYILPLSGKVFKQQPLLYRKTVIYVHLCTCITKKTSRIEQRGSNPICSDQGGSYCIFSL